jgi:hypothetical protein
VSIPYELVDATFILVALGLLAALRRFRRSAAVLLVVLLVGFLGLRAIGAPLWPDDQPLILDGSWGGSDPSLLAFQDDGTGFGQLVYAFQPGGQIRTGLTFGNSGPVPLTVTGIEPPVSHGFDRSFELLLPPGPLRPDLPPDAAEVGPAWTSVPFHPFEIPVNSDAALGLVVTLYDCPGLKPVPTLAPGSTLEPSIDPALTSGYTAVDQITIDYTVLGISRSAHLALKTPLALVAYDLQDCTAP